jgi:hypothetical protein
MRVPVDVFKFGLVDPLIFLPVITGIVCPDLAFSGTGITPYQTAAQADYGPEIISFPVFQAKLFHHPGTANVAGNGAGGRAFIFEGNHNYTVCTLPGKVLPVCSSKTRAFTTGYYLFHKFVSVTYKYITTTTS